MKGLNKATNYYNKLEAWRVWRVTLSAANRNGLIDEANLLHPKDDASCTQIYRQIDKLNKLIASRKI